MRALIYLALLCLCSRAAAIEVKVGPAPGGKGKKGDKDKKNSNEDKHFPNVLMIVVDDLRPALGAYGDKFADTPNIDKLAKAGVVFKNVFAQQASCAPSRISFLTSRRPNTLNIYDKYGYWRNDTGNFTTIPQYFKENNYYTKSVGRIFYPGRASNYSDDYPISWSEKVYHPPSDQYENSSQCLDDDDKYTRRNLLCKVVLKEITGQTLPDIQNREEATRMLFELKEKKEPFFLAVGFQKPHAPYRTEMDYFEKFEEKEVTLPLVRIYLPTVPPVAWSPWSHLRKHQDVQELNVPFPFGPMPDDFAKEIVKGYYTSVKYIDDMVGNVLDKLEQGKLDNRTIVVLLSDHGYSLGEHGEWGMHTIFEDALKVPLIFRIPDVTYFPKNPEKNKAVEVDNLVELVDLFPTLVELAGLEKLKACPKQSKNTTLCTEGKSLTPLIRQKVYNNETVMWEDKVFSQCPRPNIVPLENSDEPKAKDIRFMGYTMRTKQYRYTEWVPLNPLNQNPIWEAKIGGEWYDHKLDPWETANMFQRQDQPARAMKKKLSKALKKKFK